MQRLKKAKEELRNINNEICETTVKSAPDIDTSKIISLLKHMRVTIVDKTITLSLTTEGCLSLLVPRTRIKLRHMENISTSCGLTIRAGFRLPLAHYSICASQASRTFPSDASGSFMYALAI